MKLKSYLRGLGLGMIVTTLILVLAFRARNKEMSDEEIMARAYELGMVETSLYGSEADNNKTAGAGNKNTEESGEGKIDPEGSSSADNLNSTTAKNEKSETETTTKQPETTKKQPETTTKQPETTKPQETTTKQPETTTKQPETTKPQETTAKPQETTTKQQETTTKQPETTKPQETTAKQPETTKPQETTKPAGTEKETTAASGEKITILFEDISSADKASRLLYDAGIIQNVEEFNTYLSGQGLATKVGEGEFTFTKGMTFEEIADIITRRK